MKKRMAILMSVLMVMSLTACGGAGSTNASGDTDSQAETAETEEETAVAEEDDYEGIVLKISHNLSSVDVLNTCLEEAAANILERTDGKVEFQVYPNGELVTYAEAVEAIASDSNIVYYCAFADWADYYEDCAAFASGYVFDSVEQYQKFMDTELFASVVDALAEQNIYCLQPGWIGGFRHTLTNVPVDSLADLQGLSIRTPATKTWVDCFESLGMNVVGMAWTETLTAVSQGSIDSVEGTYSTITGYNLWDYFDYIIETKHILQAEALWMSENLWESIPEEYQEIISEELAAAQEKYVDECVALEDEMRQECIDNGMEINTDIDLTEFKEAAADNVLQYQIGQELLDTLAGL